MNFDMTLFTTSLAQHVQTAPGSRRESRPLRRPRRHLSRRLRPQLWHLLLAAGLVFCGDSAWIQAKAWLAQYLIADAWAESIATRQTVKPWPWADTWPVARLQAPQHDIDLYILDGAHGSALAFGPGRLHGTADPGLHGLSIIGGHRDTHFRFLRDLDRGDTLHISDREGGITEYRVDDQWIADINETPLMASANDERLMLVTCYPFDALQPGGSLRYVVSAVRVGVDSAVPAPTMVGS